MKTFVTMTVVAILAIAIAFVNFSQSNAQRCSDRPPVNTTEVTCDGRRAGQSQAFQFLACILRCRACYEQRELQRLPGCLVDEKCQCLGRENCNATDATSATTSDGKIPSDITDSSDTAESTDSDRELTSPAAQVSNNDDESNDNEETAATEESESDVTNDDDDTETESTTTSE